MKNLRHSVIHICSGIKRLYQIGINGTQDVTVISSKAIFVILALLIKVKDKV